MQCREQEEEDAATAKLLADAEAAKGVAYDSGVATGKEVADGTAHGIVEGDAEAAKKQQKGSNSATPRQHNSAKRQQDDTKKAAKRQHKAANKQQEGSTKAAEMSPRAIHFYSRHATGGT